MEFQIKNKICMQNENKIWHSLEQPYLKLILARQFTAFNHCNIDTKVYLIIDPSFIN